MNIKILFEEKDDRLKLTGKDMMYIIIKYHKEKMRESKACGAQWRCLSGSEKETRSKSNKVQILAQSQSANTCTKSKCKYMHKVKVQIHAQSQSANTCTKSKCKYMHKVGYL